MALLIHRRVVGVRMGLVPLREQHRGAEKHGLAPELAEHRALDLHPPHPFVVRGNLDLRQFLDETQADGEAARRIEPDPLRVAELGARCPVEVLPFPLVAVSPDHVPVGAPKLGVRDEERLDVVVPGRELGEALHRISRGGTVDHRGLAGRQPLDVRREEGDASRTGNRLVTEAPLPDRGDVGLRPDDHVDPAGDRSFVKLRREGNLKAGFGRPGGASEQPGETGNQQNPKGHRPAAAPSRAALIPTASAGPRSAGACGSGKPTNETARRETRRFLGIRPSPSACCRSPRRLP